MIFFFKVSKISKIGVKITEYSVLATMMRIKLFFPHFMYSVVAGAKCTRIK